MAPRLTLNQAGASRNSETGTCYKLHYVNVTRIGAYRVHDILECIFPCLRNSLCLSLNLAASHGADGKYWCEIIRVWLHLHRAKTEEPVYRKTNMKRLCVNVNRDSLDCIAKKW
ncbi:hypothetical protein P5673_008922 [Acropora cervicornis]|uniref:Uncharacterized protein n=1 Tax=Acropora cervicornis TaxID=6130 RepID=A0AAD9VAB2_ACRCE|nr:hypothetical protein P5673_008922 [Acropora cervicornis]